MKISGNSFSYTEIRFLLNDGYAQLHEETIYALIRLNIYIILINNLFLVIETVSPQVNIIT
jgi:hypothetical protein